MTGNPAAGFRAGTSISHLALKLQASRNVPLATTLPQSYSLVALSTQGLSMLRASRPKILISRARIRRRVRQLGHQITRDFCGQPVHLVGVLKGGCVFLADLMREIDLEISVDFLAVASYGKRRRSSGRVALVKDLAANIEGQNVILVEDILDTGRTANRLLRLLAARRPKTLRLAALLDKHSRRVIQSVHGDYVGFQIPNCFVVGYGLDLAERYRNLPDVCVLVSPPPASLNRARRSRRR